MNTLRRLSGFLVGFLGTCVLSLGLYWVSGLPFERGSLTAFWVFMAGAVAVFFGVMVQMNLDVWLGEDEDEP